MKFIPIKELRVGKKYLYIRAVHQSNRPIYFKALDTVILTEDVYYHSIYIGLEACDTTAHWSFNKARDNYGEEWGLRHPI